MNNEQFRRLVGGSTPKTPADNAPSSGASATPRAAALLGSRQKSSIPMTPRAVGFGRSDFQRQLAAKDQGEKQQQQQKRFKTSAPKGSRLADGYTDRSRDRVSEEEDDRAVRIKALEEAYKKEEIDKATFEKVRSQIAGGDLSSTHLIKGLDFKLLARVRKGEDVFGDGKAQGEEVGVDAEDVDDPEDVDEAFERLEQAKVEAIEREKAAKKGQIATTTLKPGQKRTRDMILAEMKAARAAAKAKQESALGDKFKKIGANVPGSTRIERDSKGREVLIVVDEDGHEKRKVRKAPSVAQSEAEAEEEARRRERELMMPDKNAEVLGMEVPEIYRPKDEEPEDDGDIFDDVGDDYDPLAGLESDSDSEEEGEARADELPEPTAKETQDRQAMPPPPRPASGPRNYFKDSKGPLLSSETRKAPSMSDPAIQAALKKAATLKAISSASEEDDEEAKARAEKRRRMLANEDRDAQDMDMGFGTSRFEDEADLDDEKVKLSQWGGKDDGDEGGPEGGGGGKSKRKRGGKKRKGDANNVVDIMKVIEQRKAAG